MLSSSQCLWCLSPLTLGNHYPEGWEIGFSWAYSPQCHVKVLHILDIYNSRKYLDFCVYFSVSDNSDLLDAISGHQTFLASCWNCRDRRWGEVGVKLPRTRSSRTVHVYSVVHVKSGGFTAWCHLHWGLAQGLLKCSQLTEADVNQKSQQESWLNCTHHVTHFVTKQEQEMHPIHAHTFALPDLLHNRSLLPKIISGPTYFQYSMRTFGCSLSRLSFKLQRYFNVGICSNSSNWRFLNRPSS